MSNNEPKILESVIEVCPYCGKHSLRVTEALHNVPNFGPLLIIVLKCSNCGYKHTSISHVEQHNPVRIKFRVEGIHDLNAKVIRSPTATVRIPELGIVIEPGPSSQGEITTIEGYLLRILDIVESLFEKPKRENIAKNIKRALSGEIPFTFILEDPFGNSALMVEEGSSLIKESLDIEDLKRLKYGDAILEMRRRRDV